MKRALVVFAIFLACGLFSYRVFAQEDQGGFLIENFHVDIDMKENGTFIVQEEIVVDFSERRHGIFRKIPVKYKNNQGFNFKLRLDDIFVTDNEGSKRKFKTYKEGDNFVIKIGDASTFVSGKQTYVIRYKVINGVRFFDDHSELYWNPIGTEWSVTIGNASVGIHLFRDFVFADDDAICFTGAYGSSGRDCTISVVSSDQIVFRANDVLMPQEGLTFAISFPKTLISQPTWQEKWGYFLIDNWGFGIPVFVFIVTIALWYHQGRELNLGKTTIVQYGPPDDLTPGEVGFLLKERYSTDFVSADIVNLAVKGYLKITEVKNQTTGKMFRKISLIGGMIFYVVVFVLLILAFVKSLLLFDENVYSFVMEIVFTGFDLSLFILFSLLLFLKGKTTDAPDNYQLENLKDWKNDQTLTAHERQLLIGIFSLDNNKKVTLSRLKNFHIHVNKAKKSVGKQLDVLDYFEEGAINEKTSYIIAGIIFSFAGIFIGSVMERIDIFLGLLCGGAIIVGIGLIMSKKTLVGSEAKRHIEGLRQYIYTAERYRIKFQEDEQIFEKVLPYAMVLGMADKWAKAFEGIYLHDPKWYSSRSGSFNSAIFASSISNNFSAVAGAIATPPRSSSSSGFSSGGGFSGGGGGGGGGGSW